MSSHWTEAKLFKFLRLYKRYECLWNPYSPEYRNCDAKSKAFSQILCEMNVSGLTIGECLKQIKYIRKTYKQEQQRLGSLALLGGRSYSNLLWYPMVNSMLSKVIQDEEKLTQTIGNLDLIVAPNCSPFDSGDQWTQRNLNQINYSQNTSPWDENETTMICQYLLNSGIRSNMNCYQNPNILNNSFGIYAPNEHISSCPTCGYSNGTSACGCFSMSDVGYHPDDIGRNVHSSYSQINYRPRTSYNYSNGMLEINSAVRIPVSQPSPNCGYSNLMESILPEEPEYNLDTISSDYKPEIETIKPGEASSPECCSKASSNCKNEEIKVRDGYKSQETVKHVDSTNSDPANFPSDKNGAWMKNTNKSLKKSKKTKSNIGEIQKIRTKNVPSSDPPRNSIRKSIKVEKIIADNKTSLPNINQTNYINDAQRSPGVSSERLLQIQPKILTPDPQQRGTVNPKAEEASKSDANGKREDISAVESEHEHPEKGNCCSVINTCNENTSDIETMQNLAHTSKSILKHNLTKIVIDLIDETLKKPDEESTIDVEDRLILKKVAKDLRALKNQKNCACDVESKKENNEQSKQDCNIKICNKTICWREPIEKSLNIFPCKSINFSADKTNLKKNYSVQSSKYLNEDKARQCRMMAGADSDVKDTECPLIINQESSQSDASIDLQSNSQNIGIDGEIIMIDSSLNTKNCEDQIDQSRCSTLQDKKEIGNSVTMLISIGPSDTCEEEIVDKVVNKITQVLQKALDENGYAIEKRDFFTKKNLITSGNGKINQKSIGNETVWRTELKNIIGQLMENKKVGDSIKFKVKTTILPIENSSNGIAEGVANLTSSSKSKLKLLTSSCMENYECEEKPYSMAQINQQFKDHNFDALLYKVNRDFPFNKRLLETQVREFSKRRKNVTHSKLHNPSIINRTLLPNNDYPKALWKQLRYFVKQRDRFENIPKKCKKSSRNHQHEYTLKNDSNLAEDQRKNYDLIAANFSDKLPCHFSKDIDVYLCTEISEDDQLPIRKTTGKNKKSPDSNILCEVHKNSLSTGINTIMEENTGSKSTVNSYVDKSLNCDEEDAGNEWESFSDSDEETVIVKQSYQYQNKFSQKISRKRSKSGHSNHRNRYNSSNDYFPLDDTFCEKNYPEVYALTNCKTTKNKLEILDAIVPSFDKDNSIPSQANELRNIPNLENNCKIVEAFLSDENISREELATSEKRNETSLCCELEAQEANERSILNANESEEGESLLRAKLKIAAMNPSNNLCCAQDKADSAVCTPICDISSRLRLCAILKSPNEIRSKIIRNNLSDNILCCCDDDDKLKNTDPTYSKYGMESSRKNVTLGDASLKSMTKNCQTEFFDRDPNILEEESRTSSQKPNKDNSIGYSLQINRNKACTEKCSANIQSNTQDLVFNGEPLILEIKMLQPLFSVEVKEGCKESDKKEVFIEQNSCRESVIESRSRNAVTSPVPPSENHFEESTSVTSVNYGLQKIDTDHETLSCRRQISEICKIDSDDADDREKIEPCSDRCTSSTSIDSRENKKDASTGFEETVQCNCSDPGQCNMLVEVLRSLQKDYQISHDTGINEFLGNDCVKCSEEGLPQLRKRATDESESMTLEILIIMIESSLPQITDLIIHQKLVDTIEYIRNKDENLKKHSSNEIYPQAKISQTSGSSSEKKVMETRFQSKEKSIISITEASECYKPCKQRAVDTANNCKNDRGTLGEVRIEAEDESSQSKKTALSTLQVKMESLTVHTITEKKVADQASSNTSQSMLQIAENSYCQSERPSEACDHEIEARTSQISQILENEDWNDTCCADMSMSNNKQSESQEDSRLIITSRYSSIEILCPLEQVEIDNSNSDQSIDGTLIMSPKTRNVENYESSENVCCHNGESTDVDINAFTQTVATQLRELSTEAALRSQQRIQTLISNSRLEFEKNKKYR